MLEQVLPWADQLVKDFRDLFGYQLVATVSWKISYQADGPVAASGTLPARTTTSSADYPVSEARAFLVKGTAR